MRGPPSGVERETMPEVMTNRHFNLISVCPCIVEDMKRENKLDATQWVSEFMIRSTCFGHYYVHHQELETMQLITACST
jgi:hypothetical protein